MKARLTKLAACAALTLTAGFAAPTAQAGVLVSTATSCASQSLSKPFAAWGDTNDYTPVPGGDFESGAAGWTLGGGARIVAGNETYRVGGASDAYSLYLPQGAVATSRSICVGLSEPSVRWFQKQSGSLLRLTGAMTVSVLTETSTGLVVETPVGTGLLGMSWSPSLVGVITTNLLPLLPDNKTAVAFRFRAVTGNWNVDDAYVDPLSRW